MPVIATAGDSFASLATSLSNPKKACHCEARSAVAIPKEPVIAKREALWQSQSVALLNEIATLPPVTRNDTRRRLPRFARNRGLPRFLRKLAITPFFVLPTKHCLASETLSCQRSVVLLYYICIN